MKHAILGVGAIGGLLATAMGYLGEDVTLVVRPAKLANFPRQLTLDQPNGSITTEAHPVSRLTGSVDVLWVATKTYQLDAALESVAGEAGIVVQLLNGVDHVAVLRARFGDRAVVPATIAVEADRLDDGHYAQRGLVRLSVVASGQSVLGPLLNNLQERLGFVCRFVENEQTLLWTKLCFLAPFALLTSASGKDKGGIFADPGWKATMDTEIEEAVAVAKASGAEVETSMIHKILDGSPDTMRSSMAKDLVAGRQLELDAIAGPIVRGGEKFGISVPTTRKLMAMIAAHERTRPA